MFPQFDEEHHRIAIVAMPGLTPMEHESCGLNYLAYPLETLSGLVLFYKQKRTAVMKLTWCVNHEPAISMYWQDPDGNKSQRFVRSTSESRRRPCSWPPRIINSRQFERHHTDIHLHERAG